MHRGVDRRAECELIAWQKGAKQKGSELRSMDAPSISPPVTVAAKKM